MVNTTASDFKIRNIKKVTYRSSIVPTLISRNAYHKQDSAALLCIRNVTQYPNGPFQEEKLKSKPAFVFQTR